MECRLLHGYDLDFSPNRWWWKFGPDFQFIPLPPPPPRNLPPPPRTPPRRPPQQPPPHPRESPDLQPFCLAGLRTTLAASWRDALRTLRTSPSTYPPATQRG